LSLLITILLLLLPCWGSSVILPTPVALRNGGNEVDLAGMHNRYAHPWGIYDSSVTVTIGILFTGKMNFVFCFCF
uniref:Uncharacterized protein n=1 Tax=Castor canadensis TaxID=51338 RepID=A0A8C0XQR4_CASCN